MPTYSSYQHVIPAVNPEKIYVDQNSRMTCQQMKLFNEENEYWGTFYGDVEALKMSITSGLVASSILSGCTLFNSVISSVNGIVDLSDISETLHAISDGISISLSGTQIDLSNEVSGRISADADLALSIGNEADDRRTNDSKLSNSIGTLSTGLSTIIRNLSTELSTAIDKLSAGLSTDIDELSTGLSTAINDLSDGLSTTLSALQSHYDKTFIKDYKVHGHDEGSQDISVDMLKITDLDPVKKQKTYVMVISNDVLALSAIN